MSPWARARACGTPGNQHTLTSSPSAMALLEMTISTSWQDAGPLSLRASRGRGRRQAFAAARRHSRRVRWLRFLLPLLGLSAIGVFFVLTQISLPGDIDLGVARLSVQRNSIIMDSPRLTGFDRDGREYSLSADRAVQALASPDQVRLESIDARLAAAGHGAATIKAEAGDYDHGKSTLSLLGDDRGQFRRGLRAAHERRRRRLQRPARWSRTIRSRVGYQGQRDHRRAALASATAARSSSSKATSARLLMPPKRDADAAPRRMRRSRLRCVPHFRRRGACRCSCSRRRSAARRISAPPSPASTPAPTIPIQIEADKLEVRDPEKLAIYSGNVRVRQGDTILEAPELQRLLRRRGRQPAGVARLVRSPASRPARASTCAPATRPRAATAPSSTWRSDLVTMSGNVVLTQGPNVVRGDRLVVNLATKEGRIEGGRVQTLIAPGAEIPRAARRRSA